MCGIAGFLNFKQSAAMARAANRVQRHRGPDAQGVWACDQIGLASERLSIIDLNDRANQPLAKGDLVIVFNGEIYNFRQLRKELEAQDVTFETESDTEVVLE